MRGMMKMNGSRWWKAMLIAGVLLLTILWALPYGIAQAIRHALAAAGMQSVTIEDVDFNPFSGTFGIKGLRMLNLQQQEIRVPKLEARFAWLPLLDKRLVVQRLLVQRAHMSLQQDEQGDYQLAGIPLPLMMEMTQGEPSAWSIEIRQVLFGGTLSLSLPWYEGEVHLGSVQISDISGMRAKKPFAISAVIRAGGGTLLLDGTLNPFAEKASASGVLNIRHLSLAEMRRVAAPWLAAEIAGVQGRLDAKLPFTVLLQDKPADSLRVHAGRLSLRKVAVELRDSGINKVLADTLNIDDVSYDGGWTLRQGKISGLHVHAGAGKTQQSYDVEKLNFAELDGNQRLRLTDVRIRHGNLAVQSGQQKFQLQAETLTLKQVQGGEKTALHGVSAAMLRLVLPEGRMLQAKTLVFPAMVYSGAWQLPEAMLESPLWQDNSSQRVIGRLAAGKIQAKDIQYRQDGRFSLASVHIAAPAGGMNSLQPLAGSVDIGHIAGGEYLAIGSVQVKDSRIHLRRDKRRRWWLGELPLASLAGNKDQRPWLRSMGEVHLTGGDIHIRDESVAPVYTDRFNLLSARIRDINRARPRHFSPFRLELVGKGGARLSMQGRVQPFSEKGTLVATAKVHSFSLPSINSLLGESLGYIARTGQLDADVELHVEQGRLQGESQLLLRQLEVVKLKEKGRQQEDSGLSMPLDTALDLLRNDDNDIELSIPVSGDIRNPQFNYQDAINKAVGTALQKAALGYIAETLQPYGALVTVADLAWSAGKKMMVIKLDPLRFDAGSRQPDEKQALPYLQHLAGLMNKKTSLRLTLCGKATRADRQVLLQMEKKADDEALLALASARAQHVREMLMQRFSLDSARLFLCQPAIDEAEEAFPRLEMTLH